MARAVRAAARMVERLVEDADGVARRVQVNLAESPLSWLQARGLVTRRQYEAGEVLRRDWEMAGMGARVTMCWDVGALASGGARGGRRGAPGPVEPGLAGMAARDRLRGALDAAGPGLKDVLWRVVCACEGLAAAESALGWPARAGKLVLGFGLDRVADYYRIG
ncbi:DUF6456 domain-containing protein [Sphingobium sufflavum]|uniref:DUF6456 domain-containing protein n=1 Tax=Sphingobium sufflavum TaxID=1129547 RepID=UPI001F458BBE|nr:DUF6456 domain-containing protein [Sphingobium sufflavum]MCE7798448.1 DUF6456 domain-containing protein [Sphingobium sufflavum]